MGVTIFRPGQPLVIPGNGVQVWSPGVTAGTWWDKNGIITSCVAAYQFIGSNTLTQAYANRANPGTYTITPGVAGILNTTGYAFVSASQQYLQTGVIPTTGWSWLLRYSGHDLTINTAVFGSAGAGNTVFGAFAAQGGTSVSYRNGSNAIKAPGLAGGVIASTPGKGYRNGVDEALSIGGWDSAGTRPIVIGAYNGNGTIVNYSNVVVQLLAIYNSDISAHVADLSTAAAAVAGPTIDGNLIFDGDSRTAGTGSSGGFTYPYFASVTVGLNNQIYNYGVGGQTQAAQNADAATQIDVLYNSNYRSNIVVTWGGHNDLNAASTAAATYALITSYVQARQAVGFKVVVGTVPPSSALTAGEETERQALNVLILANTAGADAVADAGSISQLQNTGNATYFTDGVHFTNAANALIATVFSTAISGIM